MIVAVMVVVVAVLVLVGAVVVVVTRTRASGVEMTDANHQTNHNSYLIGPIATIIAAATTTTNTCN